MNPLTVLMSVYNAEAFLREAIESILTQTFSKFDFLIIDDGSIDRSSEILKSYIDPRMKVITHSLNRGLIASLNEGLDLCKTPYLARMDADDIADSTRFEKQMAALEKDPSLFAVGSSLIRFGKGENLKIEFPRSRSEIAVKQIFENHLSHPTLLLRRDLLANERYSEKFIHAEDYDLWSRLIQKGFFFENLDEPLLFYREHALQVTQAKQEKMIETANEVRKNWLGYFHLKETQTSAECLRLIGHGDWKTLPEADWQKLADFFEYFITAKPRSALFPTNELMKYLSVQALKMSKFHLLKKSSLTIRFLILSGRYRWRAF